MKTTDPREKTVIEPERLSMELSALTGEQYAALQESSYIGMSKLEADAYDERRLRIGEICGLIGRLRSK